MNETIQQHLDHVAALYTDARTVQLSETNGLVLVQENADLYVIDVYLTGDDRIVSTQSATIAHADWETGHDA